MVRCEMRKVAMTATGQKSPFSSPPQLFRNPGKIGNHCTNFKLQQKTSFVHPIPERRISGSKRGKLKDPEFLVEGLLVDRSTAMIFGPTSSFKSTVMIDLAVCIQNGLPWYGQETKATNVAILSHEDGGGFKKRYLAALEKYQVVEPNVFWDGMEPSACQLRVFRLH